jgi:hypothetical protein
MAVNALRVTAPATPQRARYRGDEPAQRIGVADGPILLEGQLWSVPVRKKRPRRSLLERPGKLGGHRKVQTAGV